MWSPCSCAAATISGSTLQSRMNCIKSSGLVVFILSNIGWHSGLVVLILSQYSKIRARLLARDGQWRRWWWRSPTVSVSGWSWQNSDFPVPKWERSFSVLKRPDKYFAWIQATSSCPQKVWCWQWHVLWLEVLQRGELKLTGFGAEFYLPEVEDIQSD